MKTTLIKISRLCILVLLAVACIICMASCSDEDAETEIISVKINSDKTTVKLEATLDAVYTEKHSSEKLYLIALPTADTDSIPADATVLGESGVKGKMTFKFNLNDANGFSLIDDALVIAEKSGSSYVAITEAAYISNPEILATGSSSAPDPSGIKGIKLSDVYEAEFLGASRALVEVRMDELILPDYTDGAIGYNYGNVTYFFDGDEVEKLDELLTQADKLGIRVYLRTVLSHPELDELGEYEKEPIDLLYCDGIKAGKDGYMVNLTDEQAREQIKAFYAFLASRYSGQHGNVSDYIIGKNVNDYTNNCNAGKADAESFEYLYAAWVRLAHQTLRSVNSSAEVYVSLGNNWITKESSNIIGTKAFLSRFAASSKATGNYDWSVSVDLGRGEDLSYLLSGEGYDYMTLGVTNLSELSNLMENMDMRYSGEQRKFIIDGLALSSSSKEANRAAYYTYAYYQAAASGVDAIIYSGEGESCLYNEDGSRGDLYYSFLMCGSDLNSQLSDYTEKIKDQTIPDFSEYVARNIKYDQSALFEISESVAKTKKAFPLSLESFEAGGSVYNSQMKLSPAKDGSLGRTLLVEADTRNGFGAISSFSVPAKDVISAGYIGITMSSKTSPRVAIMISDRSTGASYVGETSTVNGESTYYFNVAEFNKSVNSSSTLDISICILPDGDGGRESVEISELSVYGSSGNGTDTVIVIVIVVVIALALGAAVFLLVRRRKKKISASDDN